MEEKFKVGLEIVIQNMENAMGRIRKFTSEAQKNFKLGLYMDTKQAKSDLESLTKRYNTLMKIQSGDIHVSEKEAPDYGLKYEKGSGVLKDANRQAKELALTIDSIKKDFDVLNSSKIAKFGNFFGSLQTKILALKNNLEDTGISSLSLKEKIGKTFEHGWKKAKRFALSLVSLRSLYSLVSRASSSYLSQDTTLTNKLQSAWIGLGAMLEPIISKIATFVIKAVSYLNVFIKALTGVDLLAKATQKSMDKANKSAKAAAKTLAGFDELTNLNQNSGAGADVNDDWANNFKNVELNPKITEFLEKIGKILSEKVWPVLKKIGEWVWEHKEEILGLLAGVVAFKLGIKIGSLAGELLTLSGVIGTGVVGVGGTGLVGGLIALDLVLSALAVYGIVKCVKSGKELNEIVSNTASTVRSNNELWKKNTDNLRKNALSTDANRDSIDKYTDSLFNTIEGAETLTTGIEKQNKFAQILSGTYKENQEMLAIYDSEIWQSIKYLGELYKQEKLTDDQKKAYAKTLADQINKLQEENSKLDTQSVKYKANRIKIDEMRKSLEKIDNEYKADVKVNADTSKAKATLKTFFTRMGSGLFSAIFPKLNFAKTLASIAMLDTGTNYVPNDQLAMIHKGEAVIPKKFNSSEYFNSGNDRIENLLVDLIDRVDRIDFNPYVTVKDIGNASVKYIKSESRIQGRSVLE